MRSNETAYTADSQLVRKYLQKNKKKVKKYLHICHIFAILDKYETERYK